MFSNIYVLSLSFSSSSSKNYYEIMPLRQVSKFGAFSGPYIPAIQFNIKICWANLGIQCECKKIRTRKNSGFNKLSHSVHYGWFKIKLLSHRILEVYEVRCAIWYHSYNLKNVKNTHGGVLTLVKLQVKAYNFTKINTPPCVFFTLLKLYKWYQIAQRTTYLTCILLTFMTTSSSVGK